MIVRQHNIIKTLLVMSFIAALFNTVLIEFGIKYLYIFLNAALIVTCLTFGLKTEGMRHFLAHFAYIFLMLLMLCISAIFFDSFFNAFIAFGLYTMPILVWICIYACKKTSNYHDLFSMTLFISGIVGYLAVVQYFFSPSLFGLIGSNSYQGIWAENKSFFEYAPFFRATSTLGSPQVLALFCALTLILCFRYKHIFNQHTFYFSVIGLFLGGVLSGGKSFFLIVGLFFFFTFWGRAFNKSYILLFIGLIFFALFFSINSITELVPTLTRVFSFDLIVEQEERVSRISKYLYILSETNPLYGNGLGSITNQSSELLSASESYFFKIYYEVGFLPILIFFVICFISLMKALNRSKTDFLIICLIMIGMLIVHAFESPIFLIIWGYFLGEVIQPKYRKLRKGLA